MSKIKQLKKKIRWLIGDRRAYSGLQPYAEYERGSENWLKAAERHFGGISRNVQHRKKSQHDPRTKTELKKGGMIGGDRMVHHGYSKHYAKHLLPFLADNRKVIVEVGILKGTGLAVWSLLFPHAKIVGMDIDPSHFRENEDALRARGAFSLNEPPIIEFDQLAPDLAKLNEALSDDRIEIFCDDGHHSDEAIMNTLRAVRPYLAENFVYFIEDNETVARKIEAEMPDLKIFSYDKLTVLEN